MELWISTGEGKNFEGLSRMKYSCPAYFGVVMT